MKKNLFAPIVFMVFSFLIIANASAQEKDQPKNQYNRVLIFTFKSGTNADSIKLIDNVYFEISKLPGVTSYQMGVVKPKDNEAKNIKHIYTLGFATEQDADYGKTPQHENLFKYIRIVSDLQMIDYWTEK